MQQYGMREVQKMLRLPRSAILAMVDAGLVSPSRGARGALLFSFQDLIVLRTARALGDGRVPVRRITKAVRQLRRLLPPDMPVSGLSIAAVGDQIVVREGLRRWRPDSGQYLLGFDGDPARGSMAVLGSRRRETEDWFDKGVALEASDPAAAMRAYEKAIRVDPAHLQARLNLGCLLHEQGRLDEAEAVYRAALEVEGEDAAILFNLGVLLEDLGRPRDARASYERALKSDRDFADCHYNLALLCDRLGERREAIRYMARYRKLTGRAR